MGRAVGRVGRQTLDIRVREYQKQEQARQDAEARTPDTTYKPNKVMYASKRANVRSGPSTSYGKVDLLEAGDRVYVVSRIGSWYKLTSLKGKSERFVYAPLLVDYNPTKKTTITYNSGNVYRGTVRDGVPHGHGVYTLASGGSYDGEWNNGTIHGYGVRIYASGNRYEGDFVDGKRTGRGVFTWADGSRYEGDFVDNRRTGHGVFVSALKTAVIQRYEGDFVDGKYHGHGTSIHYNRTRYEGNWLNGKRTGRGVWTWPNGRRYEGDFVDGIHHGNGILTWPDGRRYEGGFRNGQRHGRGVYTTAEGERYEGEWSEGRVVPMNEQPSPENTESVDSITIGNSGYVYVAIARGSSHNRIGTGEVCVDNVVAVRSSTVSSKDAKTRALNACNDLTAGTTGYPCELAKLFSNAPEFAGYICGAYAEEIYIPDDPRRQHRVLCFSAGGSGATIDEAERLAIFNCESTSDIDLPCEIRYSVCIQ